MKAKTIDRMLFSIRERLRTRVALRMDADDDDGKWITTENGHKVHLNEEGDPDKGNPYVLNVMSGGKFEVVKQELIKPHKLLKDELGIFSPGTKIIAGKDDYILQDNFMWEDSKTGEQYSHSNMKLKLKETPVRIEIKGNNDPELVSLYDAILSIENKQSAEKSKKQPEEKAQKEVNKNSALDHKMEPKECEQVKNEDKDGTIIVHGGEKYTKKDGAFVNNSGKEYSPKVNDEVKVIRRNESSTFKPTESDKMSMKICKEKFNNAFRPKGRQDSFNAYKDKCYSLFKEFDEDTKYAFECYTSIQGSRYRLINKMLRTGDVSEKLGRGWDKCIDLLTDAIDKSEVDKDTMFYRAMGTKGFSDLMGVSESTVLRNPESLIGCIGTEDGFSSCMSAKDKTSYYYEKKPVQVEIMAPKGTKALYVEPFSECGGCGQSWRGENIKVSDENETMIQRGTTYQVIGYRNEDEKHVFEVAIIEQDRTKSIYDRNRAQNR